MYVRHGTKGEFQSLVARQAQYPTAPCPIGWDYVPLGWFFLGAAFDGKSTKGVLRIKIGCTFIHLFYGIYFTLS
jgi:hypothetical protein